MKNIKKSIMTFLFYFFRIFPIKKNKIVISNFNGKGYGDSGKYIVEELNRQQLDKFDIVWLCDDLDDIFPPYVRRVSRLSIRGIYEQCTAKIWIDNRRKPIYVRKRKGQYYIQTWHGMTALKKVEKDAVNSLTDGYICSAKHDSQIVDLFLSSNNFDTKLYRESFWYEGDILMQGIPRHDILLKNDETMKLIIRKQLGILPDKKIILYAPTFRKYENGSEISLYDIGWNKLINAIEQRFGSKWVGLMRLHPNISRFSSQLENITNVINVTNYPDMQELLLVADIVITDYSSSIIEFAMTGKPGFVFAVDLNDYLEGRGSYFELDTLPFPISTSKDELVSNIMLFNENEYERKNRIFYNDVYGIYPGGHASEAVVSYINNVISK